MARTHLDRKNVKLGSLIYRLRQAIDVLRVIGLNVNGAKRIGGHIISIKFLWFVRLLTLESIPLTICKIFDRENLTKGWKRNSIYGVMARLTKHRYTPIQAKNVERFGRKFGNVNPCSNPTAFLNQTIELFTAAHKDAFVCMRKFRNEHAAHSEFGAKRENLPSIDEFEAIFDFSAEFYKLIGAGILDIGPASFPPDAGMGLWRMLKNLGLTDADFDFPPKKSPHPTKAAH